MRDNQLNDLIPSKLPCSNKKSCWGEITLRKFGEFNRIKSLNLFNMWVRGGNYKNQVKKALYEPIAEKEIKKLNTGKDLKIKN